MKSFTELCKNHQVKERFVNKRYCPYERELHSFSQYDKPCLKDCQGRTDYYPPLNDLWQWWMELNAGDDWYKCLQMLTYVRFRNPNDGVDLMFTSLEHALLACILEKLEGKREGNKGE